MNIFNEKAREFWTKAWGLVRASEGRISDWTLCQVGIPYKFARAAICCYEINTRQPMKVGRGPWRELMEKMGGEHFDRGVYYNL